MTYSINAKRIEAAPTVDITGIPLQEAKKLLALIGSTEYGQINGLYDALFNVCYPGVVKDAEYRVMHRERSGGAWVSFRGALKIANV